MNVDQALHVAHLINRRFGTHHCGDTDCEMCAARILADEVRRQQLEIEGLRRLLEPAKKSAAAKKCTHCSYPLVDGICAKCDV